MKTNSTKPYLAFLASAVLAAQLVTPSLRAEETNTLQIIKQLQQRIEDLEQKVKTLETAKPAEPVPPPPDTQSKQRIEELDQQVKILNRNRELDAEAAEAKAKTQPKITLGEQGFSLASADTNFLVQLKGLVQVDSRTFFHDSGTAGNDTLLLRRARPILQGTLFRDFDFVFVPDFGGSSVQIFDAYMNYRYSPALQFQAGKFKVPVGLEYLQSDTYTSFNERGLPTTLAPGRDIGFELHGDILGGTVSYAAGIFNGVGDNRNSGNSDFEDDKSFAGRLFVQPFKTVSSAPALQGFGVGVGGSYEAIQGTGANNSNLLPSGYVTDGQQTFFTYTNSVVASGEHWRVSPQSYWYYGPFSLLGEYIISDQGVTRTTAPVTTRDLQNTSWQIAGGWILTGEDATYNGPIVPRHPFNPASGGWGAFQLVARYEELHLDSDAFPLLADPRASASDAEAWSVGVNWWLNRNVRINTSFSHTDFQGGGISTSASAPASVTRKDENVLFTRVQLAF
jgi:phosphate-selective porin OprO/OprP